MVSPKLGDTGTLAGEGTSKKKIASTDTNSRPLERQKVEVTTAHSAATRHAAYAPFPPLGMENRPAVTTEQAAFYLNRKPQTLRIWAMTGKVIKPTRCNGRLAWPVSEIKRVLGVA